MTAVESEPLGVGPAAAPHCESVRCLLAHWDSSDEEVPRPSSLNWQLCSAPAPTVGGCTTKHCNALPQVLLNDGLRLATLTQVFNLREFEGWRQYGSTNIDRILFILTVVLLLVRRIVRATSTTSSTSSTISTLEQKPPFCVVQLWHSSEETVGDLAVALSAFTGRPCCLTASHSAQGSRHHKQT